MFNERYFDVVQVQSVYVCKRPPSISSAGVFVHDDPFQSAFPMLLAQMVVLFLGARMTHFVLRHLGQPSAVSYALAGMLLGPGFLGRLFRKDPRDPYSGTYGQMMKSENMQWLRIITGLGDLFYSIVIGVKTDVTMLRRSGKKAVAIALMNCVPTICLSYLLAWTFQTEDPTLRAYGMSLGTAYGVTSFIVLSILLEEFQMLTSKLGRLAMSAALIAQMLSLAWSVGGLVCSFVYLYADYMMAAVILATTMAVLVALYLGVRPLTIWMIKQTPPGQELGAGFFTTIMVATVGLAVFFEVMGFSFTIGAMVVGLFLPGGPPLGSALVRRIDRFVSGILIPINLASLGAGAQWFAVVELPRFGNLLLLVLVLTLSKILGVLGPCIYCRIPLRDAFLIALMLNCRGIIELTSAYLWAETEILDDQGYVAAIVAPIIFGSITGFLIKAMYKPSMRFLSYRRRTIQHTKPGDSLRVLVAVNSFNDTPPAIRLFDTSNPSNDSAIHLYVLQLVPLIGHAAAVLSPLWREGLPKPPDADRIAGAFALLERRHPRRLVTLPYVSMAPKATMHDDICAMALDKKAALVLLPFHGSNAAHKTTCVRVFSYAPCSVGILVDHGPGGDRAFDDVGVFFLGGADDREALAYAKRIAQGTSVTVTVLRFRLPEERTDLEREDILDDAALRDFRERFVDNERVVFREEVVQDGPSFVNVIRLLCDHFGLVIVGRRKGKTSMLTMGLEEWSEYPELGILGDMLASSDFEGKVSTLVLQQQARVDGRASH